MSERLDPEPIFALVAAHVPPDLRAHLVIVGSLAAAYSFRNALAGAGVNTKDADILVTPAGALVESAMIARRLLDDGWQRLDRCRPQASAEPLDTLSAVRLNPPGTTAYFIELLGVPETEQSALKTWRAFELADGWYGLPCFRFMGLSTFEATRLPSGLRCARPAMMALANLLSHPTIGNDTMSDTGLLRSAKDLGRVLGLATLTDFDALETWPHGSARSSRAPTRSRRRGTCFRSACSRAPRPTCARSSRSGLS